MRKVWLKWVTTFSAVLGASSLVLAGPIQLRPAQTLQDGSSPLLPGTVGVGYAIPCVTDWNGDGKKDLLVGFQNAGKIALYLNQGTDAQPAFTNYTTLKTGDGKEICHPSGGCGAPACWVCDFDHDGRRDLLVGSGADGSVWFYQNTNTDAAPRLASGVKLLVGTAPLSVGMRSTPYVCDWDGDGLDDLLCGAGDGYVYFFRNTNTAQSPLLASAVKIQAGGANLFLGIRSVVRFNDWDGDGLKDLVCSSDTGVYWCRNTGTNLPPVLEAPQAIRAPVPAGGYPALYTGPRMRLELVDWNDDGVMDLLVGNAYGTVYFYEGYQFRIWETAKEAENIVLRWTSAPYLKYSLLSCSVAGGNCPLVSGIPSGGTTTTWTNLIQGDHMLFRVQIEP